jgi:hypothetical protein
VTNAELFQDAFQAEAASLKAAHEHVHQATNDVAAIFQAEEPDLPALRAALSKLDQARGEAHGTTSKILQNVYAKVSLEGRQRLAVLTQSRM